MLKRIGCVALPYHSRGGFDHGDVHHQTGRVFVAHTANGTVEVIDGEQFKHATTLDGCPEASGIICVQQENVVFATARGTGRILMIDANTLKITQEFVAGSRPNGLAWNTRHGHLLVADVQDNNVRLVNPRTGRITNKLRLPGRPRWCAYDSDSDRFLVNIMEPAGVSFLRPDASAQTRFLSISIAGPHGLDLDRAGRAFVACDEGALVVLDLKTERELKAISIAGAPDVIWLNTRHERLYCAIGKPGVVEVTDTKTMTSVGKIQTEEGSHTLTFDQLRQRLYIFLPRSCRVVVYSEEF